MEKTWASGAIELLRHADSHIHLETAFDRRIAFISIDNSVETSIRTFLSLPQSKSGVKIPRKDVEAVENSFPGLLNLLWQHVGTRLTGIDEADIEHYHRIRNKLYHDGTGLGVDEQYLLAYRQITVLLLKNLFAVTLGEPKPAPTLERLIVLWNKIEEVLGKKFANAGIQPGSCDDRLTSRRIGRSARRSVVLAGCGALRIWKSLKMLPSVAAGRARKAKGSPPHRVGALSGQSRTTAGALRLAL